MDNKVTPIPIEYTANVIAQQHGKKGCIIITYDDETLFFGHSKKDMKRAYFILKRTAESIQERLMEDIVDSVS